MLGDVAKWISGRLEGPLTLVNALPRLIIPFGDIGLMLGQSEIGRFLGMRLGAEEDFLAIHEDAMKRADNLIQLLFASSQGADLLLSLGHYLIPS